MIWTKVVGFFPGNPMVTLDLTLLMTFKVILRSNPFFQMGSHTFDGGSLLDAIESPQTAGQKQTRAVISRKVLLSDLSCAPQDRRTAVADSRYLPESRLKGLGQCGNETIAKSNGVMITCDSPAET